MFRRMASRTRKDPGEETSRDLFMTIQEQQRNVIRAKLLECLANEKVAGVRNKIGDAVAEVARQYTMEGVLKENSKSYRLNYLVLTI